MLKLLWFVLWPSFMVAGAAELAFFSVINPQELYLFGEPVNYSRVATYSIGFFGFWLVCAASSILTLYLTRSPREVNRPTV
jgi:hypothetical protein